MKHVVWSGTALVAICSVVFILACGDRAPGGNRRGDTFDTQTDTRPDATDDQDPLPDDEIHLAASRAVTQGGFATAKVCSDCHSNDSQSDAMRDASGDPIGFYDLWRASMMANASRDPLWRAMVSAETAATPAASEAIEDKCMTCHAPMARTLAHEAGGMATISMLHDSDAQAMLGLDGVSCTTCHKIEPDNFGQASSFSGGYEINPNQIAYGPFQNPFARPMSNRSGFEPLYGDHMRESELCATCHTLHTSTLDAQGNTVAEGFPEQTPYLEWLNSDFNTDGGSQAASCQSCHEPQTDDEGNLISTEIARRPGGGSFPPTSARQPVGRHLFIGGNTLVPSILRDHADALEPQAPSAAFDELIRQVQHQLQNDTARVSIASTQKTAEGLRIGVDVANLTGHKFPTGFPSRRAWLHVSVRDAAGEVVFESGDWNERGQLVDASGGVLTIEAVDGPVEPHRDLVTASEQVQIYEPIMAGVDGRPVFRLLRAESYAKDTRLLPSGWVATHAQASDTAPAGVDADANFQGGADRVVYEVALNEVDGEFTVDAELVYQVLGARFAAEIFTADTRPMQVFEQYYEKADVTPELVARDSVVIE